MTESKTPRLDGRLPRSSRRAGRLALAAMLPLLAFAAVGLAGQGAQGADMVSVPESRIYTLEELARLLSIRGGEHRVSAEFQVEKVYVSKGSYGVAEIERALEAATGLAWRRVRDLTFLGVYLHPRPSAEDVAFSQRLVDALGGPLSPITKTPFTAAQVTLAGPERRPLPFASLSRAQQLWLAANVKAAATGFGDRPLTPAELESSTAALSQVIVLTVGMFSRFGTFDGKDVYYARAFSNLDLIVLDGSARQAADPTKGESQP